MALAAMGVILVVLADSAGALAACMAALLVMIAYVSGFRDYGRWFLLVSPMALFFGLVTAWAVDPGSGILAGLKLMTLTTVGYLFFITTPPEDLANSLVIAGLPYSIAFVMGAGMQFVPVLGRKARDVLDAQKARGIPIKAGWRSLRNFPAFLLPLLVQAFQLAEELAEAMETRGFGRPDRSFYREFTLTRWDYLIIMAGAAVTAVLGWAMSAWP
jgi:energy-coupling factor transport system permease protein